MDMRVLCALCHRADAVPVVQASPDEYTGATQRTAYNSMPCMSFHSNHFCCGTLLSKTPRTIAWPVLLGCATSYILDLRCLKLGRIGRGSIRVGHGLYMARFGRGLCMYSALFGHGLMKVKALLVLRLEVQLKC